MPTTREAMDYLSPDLMASARPRWRAADTEAGAAVEGFLAWPSLGVGALYDSNPLQIHVHGGSAAGVRFTPRFVAERETGVHATTVYGAADARLYPARSDADQLDGRAGILHDWAPRRDLIVRLQGEIGQNQDPIDSRLAVTGVPRGRPFTERDAILAASVQKTFGVGFIAPAADIERLSFAEGGVRTRSGAQALSAQTGTDVAVRIGARLGPALYAFAEPSANWRVLDVGDQRSDGTRIVAGLGAERIGLFDGALFAGVQRQSFTRAPTEAEPVFGGRLRWSPTPAWSVFVTLDRRLAQAAVGTLAEPLGTPIDAVSERVTARFAPVRAWSGEVAVEHVAITYLPTGRVDDLVGGSLSLAYLWRHDLTLTADVTLTKVTSSVRLASYDRALATLGARYAY